MLICCGLYDLLRGVLLILPDIMLEDVMDKLIQPDYLIVLVNHPSPLIQQGVIKVGLYQMFSPKKMSTSMVNMLEMGWGFIIFVYLSSVFYI